MRRRGSITAVVAALAIAGCGGGSGSQGPKPPTKQQYVAKVDMICGALKSDLRGLQGQLQGTGMGGSKSQQFMRLANALDKTIQVATRRIDQIKSTPRPSGQAGQGATRYVQSLDQELTGLKQLRDAAERKDVNAFRMTAAKLAQLAPRSNGIAQGYGLKTCASSP